MLLLGWILDILSYILGRKHFDDEIPNRLVAFVMCHQFNPFLRLMGNLTN